MRLRLGPGVLLASAALAAACSGPEAFLDSAGPGAEEVSSLWWVMFALGATIYAVVLALVGVPVLRRLRSRPLAAGDDRELTIERRFLGGVVGGSLVVLFGLYLLALPVLRSTSPSTPDQGGGPSELTIEVTGRQFWWEVRYPDRGVVTANEIHIPAGEPVRFRLTSEDVIHSFWIPRLHGKVDMTPGHTTELVLTADEPGHYRGRCTEYCGIAHAQMILHVFAEEPGDFDAWLDREEQDAADPETEDQRRGQAVFLDACAACHSVRGHGASGGVGPDLTHFADREFLGAGVAENSRDQLLRWVQNPHIIKPGAPMPPFDLDEDELEALLDYLESLR